MLFILSAVEIASLDDLPLVSGEVDVDEASESELLEMISDIAEVTLDGSTGTERLVDGRDDSSGVLVSFQS